MINHKNKQYSFKFCQN